MQTLAVLALLDVTVAALITAPALLALLLALALVDHAHQRAERRRHQATLTALRNLPPLSDRPAIVSTGGSARQSPSQCPPMQGADDDGQGSRNRADSRTPVASGH